jgi:hypothetical protein
VGDDGARRGRVAVLVDELHAGVIRDDNIEATSSV